MGGDTIFALATPVGGAIAVVRISGPEAGAVLSGVFTGDCAQAGHMAYGSVRRGEVRIDAGMGVRFAAPRSYTGEDMAELYLHGGRAVVRETLAALAAVCRQAEPGEFTRRAFLNGKLALSEAEAVMDLIRAETDRSARAALAQLGGALHRECGAIEEALLGALSLLDAAIDYPEEMEDTAATDVPARLQTALARLEALLTQAGRGRILREGASVVLLGRPNAGKSTLLNALLGCARAIVTDVPGTTRDTLEESADFCGVPVRLTDTAGLRASDDAVEQLGVARAQAAAAAADLLLLCLDASAPGADDAALFASYPDTPKLVVLCKSDLAAGAAPQAGLAVSALRGTGIEELRAAIAAAVAPAQSPLLTNVRHIAALTDACTALKSALAATDMELTATDLRAALLSLGEVTGSTVDEAVLDRIFADFCVGK